jgi:hypothetical protein
MTATQAGEGDIVVAVQPALHEHYGLAYPVTHELSVPPSGHGLKAYRRDAGTDSWTPIPEMRAGDFFNGVEAARFAPGEGKAYLSVAFSAGSDSLHLRITDSLGTPLAITHLGVSKYYDNRKAVVVCTADDWHQWFADYFRESLSIFRQYRIWVTGGIVTDTGWCTADTWAQIQEQLDSGYVEAGAHSRNHLWAPYDAVGYEVTGARFDIINNLSLPSLFRRGASEYVYVWVAPYGSYDDAIDQRVGLNRYLVSRLTNSAYYDISPWDGSTGHYAPIGVAYEIGEATWGGVHDLATLDSTFDAVVSRGMVYHFMVHPHVLDQYGTWGKPYLRWHLEHISNRPDIWYAALGHLYLYTKVRESLEVPTTVADSPPRLPTAPLVLQNYPNPFNAVTTIAFELPRSAGVALRVFNLLGQEVASPVIQTLTSGRHEITVDASRLPSGTYIYRIESDGFVGARKMVLAK